ncbi:MAG: AbrB/MazE/SpoVT family DNA-binding domain-containing protein [Anaerolineaceae bacterium]
MAAPKGKHIFGIVKVGEKGQIVIPKEARKVFDIKPGDSLLMLGDETQGIAIVKSEGFLQFAEEIFSAKKIDEDLE